MKRFFLNLTIAVAIVVWTIALNIYSFNRGFEAGAKPITVQDRFGRRQLPEALEVGTRLTTHSDGSWVIERCESGGDK